MLNKLEEIINHDEELELKKLANNPILLSGIKKILLNNLYYQGVLDKSVNPEPRRNFICQLLYNEDMSMDYNIDDDRLGQKTRAVVEAIRLIEQGYKEIENFKKEKPAVEIDISNQAR